MNIQTFKKLAPVYFNAKLTPLLVGVHGIGKTETVRQIGKDNGFDRVLEVKLGNLNDSADLLGLFEFKDTPSGKRTVYARPDFWPKEGEKVLVFFDELNRCTRSLVQPVMELALELKHHDYKLPEGCRVIAAMNPDTEEYQVESFDDNAYISRFCQIKLEPSVEEWGEYLKTQYKDVADVRAVDFFVKRKKFLESKSKEFVVNVTPDRRKVTKLILDVIPQKLSKDDLMLVSSSMIGAEASITFINEYFKPFDDSTFTIEKLMNSTDGKIFDEFNKKVVQQNRIDFIGDLCDSLIENTTLTYETDLEINNLCSLFSLLPLETLTNLIQKIANCKNEGLIKTGLDDRIVSTVLGRHEEPKAELVQGVASNG